MHVSIMNIYSNFVLIGKRLTIKHEPNIQELIVKKTPDHVLVIHQVACNREQLVNTPTYGQRYNHCNIFFYLLVLWSICEREELSQQHYQSLFQDHWSSANRRKLHLENTSYPESQKGNLVILTTSSVRNSV